jgi:PilZ domain.
MEEKRHSRRMPIELNLEISSLFKQENVRVDDVHAPIEVFNISKTGIGFKSTSVLPLNYYFNAKLALGDAESILYCVVRIVRAEAGNDDKTIYGCEFVGLAPVLTSIIEEYEKALTDK